MSASIAEAQRQKSKVIGWRECIALPSLGIANIKAKIDTGARTSALHAVDLRPFEQDGAHWIEFRVPRAGLPSGKRCRARIVDERSIKNTSGVPERRYVVETTLVMGPKQWRVELSLANRQEMAFEVILGRTAVRRLGLLVNPGRSFLVGPPRNSAQEDPGNP